MADLMEKHDLLRYIRCTTGSETYALDMASVYSIQRSDNLHLEPGVKNTLGWFPVRDEQAPVFGLAESLGHPGQSQFAGRRVVLMNPLPGKTGMWGLLVDQVSQVFSTSYQALNPLPGALCAGEHRYFGAALQTEDELVLMLEPAGIYPPGIYPAGVYLDQPLPVAGDIREVRFAKEPVSKPAGGQAAAARRIRGQKQLIVFALPGENHKLQYALSITQVLEILAPLPVIPVPGAAPYIPGLVNWRNHPVPLIDLQRRLGLEVVRAPDLARLMIVRAQSKKREQVFGFLVDPVIHMLRLPVEYRAGNLQANIPEQFVKSVVEIDGKLTVIPELSNLLVA
jgi:chemotaxis signal transduction protein